MKAKWYLLLIAALLILPVVWLAGTISGQNKGVKPRLKNDIVMGLRMFRALDAGDVVRAKNIASTQLIGKQMALRALIDDPLLVLRIPVRAPSDSAFESVMSEVVDIHTQLLEAAQVDVIYTAAEKARIREAISVQR
jgi:hypothetical protein